MLVAIKWLHSIKPRYFTTITHIFAWPKYRSKVNLGTTAKLYRFWKSSKTRFPSFSMVFAQESTLHAYKSNIWSAMVQLRLRIHCKFGLANLCTSNWKATNLTGTSAWVTEGNHSLYTAITIGWRWIQYDRANLQRNITYHEQISSFPFSSVL